MSVEHSGSSRDALGIGLYHPSGKARGTCRWSRLDGTGINTLEVDGIPASATPASVPQATRRSHLRQLRDELTPALHSTLFFGTVRAPLFLGGTHEERQFLQLVGRMEWHLPRLGRYFATRTSA